MYILSIKHAPVRLSNGADVLTMSKISPKIVLIKKISLQHLPLCNSIEIINNNKPSNMFFCLFIFDVQISSYLVIVYNCKYNGWNTSKTFRIYIFSVSARSCSFSDKEFHLIYFRDSVFANRLVYNLAIKGKVVASSLKSHLSRRINTVVWAWDVMMIRRNNINL